MSVIDEYIMSRPGKERQSGVIYVTDVCKFCLRQAYFDIVSPKRFDVSTLRVFEVGRMVEDLVVRALSQKVGCSVLGTQVQARWPLSVGSIHGRVDVLMLDQGGVKTVVEVKSIKNFYYLEGPKPEHVAQINFYLNVLGVDRGELFYVSKEAMLSGGLGAPVEKRFPIRRDLDAFADMVGRGEVLHMAVVGGVVPGASPCFLCRGYCNHVGCEYCASK